MIDSDLDLRLRRWLSAEASTTGVPERLRGRVLGIPAAHPRREGWWNRFVSVPVATGAVAAMTLVAMVFSGAFFTLFDRPPGTDGGPCNDRQLQRALDDLRDTSGYRYTDSEQHQILVAGSDALENPVFEWVDALTSTVAYRAPDRTHEVVTAIDRGTGRGYLEQVRIGGEQWQLREIDGDEVWVRIEPWPFGNWAYGYIQNALGVPGLPGIASMQFGSTPVPEGLPGAGGCTIATAGEAPNRVVALRVDRSGRVSDIYLGPAAGAPGQRDAYRNLIRIEYTVPDESEFVPPDDFADETELYPGVSQPPEPTVVPIEPGEGAWVPSELPVPDTDATFFYVSDWIKADRRYVVLGTGVHPDNRLQSLVWTSEDAVTWTLGESPEGFTGMSLSEVASDGSTLVAIGYRTQERRADGTADPDRPETWLSTDGLAWEPGDMFEAGANPSELVPTDEGWVAGGSIWSGNIQRPVFFVSTDGAEWTTIRPPNAAFGFTSTPVVEADGSITARSCETPEETNTASSSPCLVRIWTSQDGGLTWTPGPVIDDRHAVSFETPVGDHFLGIRYDDAAGDHELVRSENGETWETLRWQPGATWLNELVPLPDGGVLLIGQRTDAMMPAASIWRSADGVTWDEVPLGVLDGGVSMSAEHVIVGEHGLTIIGAVWLDEMTSRPVVWIEPDP